MLTKEQEAALYELECDTHVLWNEKKVHELTQPFGFVGRTFVHEADGHRNPKGLTLKDGAKQARGASSWDISGQIAQHVGAKPVSCLGRGFQVRADCDAVRKHLNQKED